MEVLVPFLALLGLALAVSPLVALVVALRTKGRVRSLEFTLAGLRKRLAELEARADEVPRKARVREPSVAGSGTPESAPPEPGTPESEPAEPATTSAPRRVEPALAVPGDPAPTQPSAPTPDVPHSPFGEAAERRSAESIERRVGERVFNRLGIAVLVIGVALFLAYVVPHIGPWGRIGLAALLGGAMLLGGVRSLAIESLRYVAVGLISGGWAVMYALAFAVHNVAALRQVESPGAATMLMVLVAAAMVAHVVRLGDTRGIVLVHAFAALGIVASPPGLVSGLALTVLGLAHLVVADRLVRPAVAVASVPLTLLGQTVWLLRTAGPAPDPAPIQWAFVVQVALLGAALWRAQRSASEHESRSGRAAAERRQRGFAFGAARVTLLLGTAVLVAMLEGTSAPPGPWLQLLVLAVMPAVRAVSAFGRTEATDFVVSVTLAVLLTASAAIWALESTSAQLALAGLSVGLMVLGRIANDVPGSVGDSMRALAFVPAVGSVAWSGATHFGRALREGNLEGVWFRDGTLLVLAVVLHALAIEFGRGPGRAGHEGEATLPRPGAWLDAAWRRSLSRVPASLAITVFVLWTGVGGIHPSLGSVALALGAAVLFARAEGWPRPRGVFVQRLEVELARTVAVVAGIWVLESIVSPPVERPLFAQFPLDVSWAGLPAVFVWGGIPAACLTVAALPARPEMRGVDESGPHAAPVGRVVAAVTGVGVWVGIASVTFPDQRMAPVLATLALGFAGALPRLLGTVDGLARRVDDASRIAWMVSGMLIAFAALVPLAASTFDLPTIDAVWVRWGLALWTLAVAVWVREALHGAVSGEDRIVTGWAAIVSHAGAWSVVGATARGLAFDLDMPLHVFPYPLLAAASAIAAALRGDPGWHSAGRVVLVLVVATSDAEWSFSPRSPGLLDALALVPALLAVLVSAEAWRAGFDRGVWSPRTTAPAPLFEPVVFVLIGGLYARQTFDGGYLTTALSGLAAFVVAYGFVRRWQAFRVVGLAMLGVCVLKAFVVDLSGLDPIYRIASFLVLGALLVAVSLVYARYGRDENGDPSGGDVPPSAP